MYSIHRFKPIALTLALSLAIAELFSLTAPNPIALAEPQPRSSTQKRPAVRPPSGRPRRTIGGGSRGQCPPVELGATAIVPLTEAETLSDRPTLWFYNPYSGPNRSAKLTLEQAGELITDPITIRLPSTPGLINVQIPSTLTPDQSYRWVLTIDCKSDQPQSKTAPQPPLELEGSLRRITLTPTDQKKLTKLPKNSREQFEFYVTKNLWLDAIALTLDRPTPLKPSDQTTQWETLLNNLELQALAPILINIKP